MRYDLKIFRFLALVAMLFSQDECSVNFGRGHYEEHFCELILNLDQWFRRRCCLKTFLIKSSGCPFFRWSRTICAILVEGIMKINSVKLFLIRTSGSGDVV